MNEPEIAQRKTAMLRLTRYELLHLRDLFAVLLPPEMKDTLSQRLALTLDRTLVEARLWQKLARACDEMGLPTGDAAPDFVVAAATAPAIGVFELAHDPVETQQAEAPPDLFEAAAQESQQR